MNLKPIRRASVNASIFPIHAGVFTCLLSLLILFSGFSAHASVAILLEQPYGGMGVFNPTGHSALYFNHICADTPVHLRPCEAGETGVVISRYDGIGTLDWVAMPLIPYLYGVDDAKDIPSSMDRLTALRMRDVYRREHLESVAPDTETGGIPQGNWYELVGSAYDRTIYGFQIATTTDQDQKIIAMFNDRPNVTRYNGAFRNCADFVRSTVNRLYPHAIRRNYVADFGLTTPKAVAHSLSRYGNKHPEVGLQVFQVRQLPGTLPRSVGVQGVSESLLKRYAIPMVVLSPDVTAVVLVAYLGRGRFDVPKDAPVLDLAAISRGDQNPSTFIAVGRAWNFEEQARGESAGYFSSRTPTPDMEIVRNAGSAAVVPVSETPSNSFEHFCVECGSATSFR